MNAVSRALERLKAGAALSAEDSRHAVGALVDGEAGDALAAAFLSALRETVMTADVLEGAVAAVRDRMIPWECGIPRQSLLDTCGTGGDGASTVNISRSEEH